jgi:hypothetical protein
LEDLEADGRIIIRIDLKETGCEGVNWIQMVQDRVQWRALMNTAMNLRVP